MMAWILNQRDFREKLLKLDGGETHLYAVCRLHDVVDCSNGEAQLLSRDVHLQTRQLGTGTQIPF